MQHDMAYVIDVKNKVDRGTGAVASDPYRNLLLGETPLRGFAAALPGLAGQATSLECRKYVSSVSATPLSTCA